MKAWSAGRWVIAGVVAAYAAVAVLASWPADADDYRGVAVRSANDALSQVRTVRLVLQSEVDGAVLSPYASTVVGQAREDLATAVTDFAGEEVPDRTVADVAARLGGLLDEALRAVGAAEAALDADGDGAAGAVRALSDVGDRLAAFSEENR